jgi:uncharacterized protein (DUF1501 family)
MPFTRRQFLKTSLAASAAAGFPAIWSRVAEALQPCEAGVNVVIVHLEGGNDGINMVIPMTDGSGMNRTVYDNSRLPRSMNNGIAIDVADLAATQVGDDPGLSGAQLALHPHMGGPNVPWGGLKNLYDSQNLAIVLGVHYPQKSLDHDESSNIWYKADPDNYGSTGWMGRTLDQMCSGQSAAVPAVDTDSQLTPLFYGNTSVLSFTSISSLNFPLSGNLKTRYTTIHSDASTSGLNFVKDIGNSGYSSVTKIDAYKLATAAPANLNDLLNGTTTGSGGFGVQNGATKISQSGNQLAKRLKTVYQLMRGGPPGTPLGCRIFRASIGGFDTHSAQGFHIPLTGSGSTSLVQKIINGFPETNENDEEHGRLMHRVSSAIAAFWADLKAAGLHKNTVIMTFSEFGRSVEQNQNDSNGTDVPGTDHSTTAPMFIIGPNSSETMAGVPLFHGAMYGAYQDLDALDGGGDPHFQVDLRSVYGEIMCKWLGLSQSVTNSLLPTSGGFPGYSPMGIIT